MARATDAVRGRRHLSLPRPPRPYSNRPRGGPLPCRPSADRGSLERTGQPGHRARRCTPCVCSGPRSVRAREPVRAAVDRANADGRTHAGGVVAVTGAAVDGVAAPAEHRGAPRQARPSRGPRGPRRDRRSRCTSGGVIALGGVCQPIDTALDPASSFAPPGAAHRRIGLMERDGNGLAGRRDSAAGARRRASASQAPRRGSRQH